MKLTSIIKFTAEKDFRCFKTGDVIEWNLHWPIPFYLVGKNGSGKSTLLQKMRSTKDSLKSERKSMFDGMTSSAVDQMEYAPIKVEGLDEFDNIFYLDSVTDDPTSFENSASAGGLIMGGGMTSMRISKGQKAMLMLVRFVKDINKKLGIEKDGVVETTDCKTLIIVDEADEGLDLKSQLTFHRILENWCLKYNACVICVTHNPICMVNNTKSVYDISSKSEIKLEDYIKEISGGYEIQLIEPNKE